MDIQWKEILLSLLPLFVAMDALGGVPVFLALTSDLDRQKRQKLVRDACLTALIVSVLFLIGGKYFFAFLGITADDFRVAGGTVLLVLAISDLILSYAREARQPDDTVGVVPIGIPLIMGPAALTTILILQDTHGYAMTMISITLNLLFVFISFRQADTVTRVLGAGGSKALSKVMALFLAAIAVMMIRVGLTGMLGK